MMIVYCALNNNTSVKVDVEMLSPEIGVGRIDCLECGGSGWWDFGPPGTEGQCVTCKGTGKMLVSI